MQKTHTKSHTAKHISKLNWLRAAVLGADDGIVSIAGLVVGIAGATNSAALILTAGIAGIIAGSISMAVGEYVSVSSSRDVEKSLLAKERLEHEHYPDGELKELTQIYQDKGLSEKTAKIVAEELSAKDPVAAHFDAELRIDPENLTNPWHAASASALSFLLGGLVPLIAISFPSQPLRVPFAFVAVVVALVLTGILSAKVGGANVLRAVVRVVTGGILAMAVTYGIGSLFKVSGI
jgi:VIT1/CCC1 family predicted Fe2+/Mn2+ transporter